MTVTDNSTTTFSARATDTAGNDSGCSTPVPYSESTPVPGGGGSPGGSTGAPAPPPAGPLVQPPPLAATGCRVPALRGKTLAQAKAALRAARCQLGKVTKPKRSRGKKLVVKATSPKAGARRVAGAKVALTMKVKPQRKRKRR